MTREELIDVSVLSVGRTFGQRAAGVPCRIGAAEHAAPPERWNLR